MARRRAPTVKRVPLEELTPDPDNARLRTGRNTAAIRGSLERFGAARSLVIDSDNVVRAGNGTLEEARDQGLKSVLIVEVDGKELVAVRRADWDEQEARAYAVADNRSGELAEWDWELLGGQLQTQQEAGFDLEALGWLTYEVDPLVKGSFNPKPPGNLNDFDDREAPLVIRLEGEARRMFETVAAQVGGKPEDVVEALCRSHLEAR